MLNGKDNYSYVIVQTETKFRDLFGTQELHEARKNYRTKSTRRLGLGYIKYLEALTKQKLKEQDGEEDED
jgi:hypothetical protein|nr:MAG TPA: hypothetical protein [Caudoviricetes sp.]